MVRFFPWTPWVAVLFLAVSGTAQAQSSTDARAVTETFDCRDLSSVIMAMFLPGRYFNAVYGLVIAITSVRGPCVSVSMASGP